jgi:threonine dehydratase
MQERERNRGERIAVVLSGANIDRRLLASILAEPSGAAA